MLRLADRIDQFSTAVGRVMAWLVLFVVIVQFVVVLLRYVFGLGSIWLQESIVYAHAFAFLLASAWVLKTGGHVRVDVFYRGASARTRAWVDLLGTLFLLLPMAVLILSLSLPYADRAWVVFERSQEISGLPSVFLLKTAIPVAAVMLIIQGCAQILRAAVLLEGPRPRTRKRKR
jgi:TRAP-type mannitol/chloroaromatic compound transport system permease small subunit